MKLSVFFVAALFSSSILASRVSASRAETVFQVCKTHRVDEKRKAVNDLSSDDRDTIWTLLRWSCESGFKECFEEALNLSDVPFTNDSHCLKSALEHRFYSMVERMLEHPLCDLSGMKVNPLILAIENDDGFKSFDLLLNHGSWTEGKGLEMLNEILHSAAYAPYHARIYAKLEEKNIHSPEPAPRTIQKQ